VDSRKGNPSQVGHEPVVPHTTVGALNYMSCKHTYTCTTHTLAIVPPLPPPTSATAKTNATHDAMSPRKSGSRATPGRYTNSASRWNHLRSHTEEGLVRGEREWVSDSRE